MRFPYSISSSDTIATAVSVLRETGVSRLPVIGKGNKLDGLLEALRAILRAEGPYSRDRLTHAENTIWAMKALAEVAITQASPPTPEPTPEADVKLPPTES